MVLKITHDQRSGERREELSSCIFNKLLVWSQDSIYTAIFIIGNITNSLCNYILKAPHIIQFESNINRHLRLNFFFYNTGMHVTTLITSFIKHLRCCSFLVYILLLFWLGLNLSHFLTAFTQTGMKMVLNYCCTTTTTTTTPTTKWKKISKTQFLRVDSWSALSNKLPLIGDEGQFCQFTPK